MYNSKLVEKSGHALKCGTDRLVNLQTTTTYLRRSWIANLPKGEKMSSDENRALCAYIGILETISAVADQEIEWVTGVIRDRGVVGRED